MMLTSNGPPPPLNPASVVSGARPSLPARLARRGGICNSAGRSEMLASTDSFESGRGCSLGIQNIVVRGLRRARRRPLEANLSQCPRALQHGSLLSRLPVVCLSILPSMTVSPAAQSFALTSLSAPPSKPPPSVTPLSFIIELSALTTPS